MQIKKGTILLVLAVTLFFDYRSGFSLTLTKYKNNPVISTGPFYGWDGKDVYDVSVLVVDGKYRMWYSAREGSHSDFFEYFIELFHTLCGHAGLHNRIGYAESGDSLTWLKYPENPVLNVGEQGKWDDTNVDRPSVVCKDGLYHMWFTGWNRHGCSAIGHAVSSDGIHWKKTGKPVLVPTMKWERQNLMCPNVIYDEQERKFKMWYSGGEAREPDSIGYAESMDGVNWRKYPLSPIFTPAEEGWDGKKIGSFQVIKKDGAYYAFYNAFDSSMNSRIGVARSLNGINHWIRYPGNPVLRTGQKDSWDCCNVYKPAAVIQGHELKLFYNAANRDRKEQVGLATAIFTGW